MSRDEKQLLQTLQSVVCILTVPGECAFILCVCGVGPAAPTVLIAFGPFSPQWCRDVACGFIFSGQELVKRRAGLGCHGYRPAVTASVLVVSHPEDRLCLSVTATTWSRTVEERGQTTCIEIKWEKRGEGRAR